MWTPGLRALGWGRQAQVPWARESCLLRVVCWFLLENCPWQIPELEPLSLGPAEDEDFSCPLLTVLSPSPFKVTP